MLQEKDELTSSVTEQATVRACLRAVDIDTANEHCVEGTAQLSLLLLCGTG